MTDETDDLNRFKYQTAEEIRRFEIKLIWDRALYFWGFLSVVFAGYAALKTSESSHPILSTLVACVGLVSAFAWTLSNRGSKFWFHVWEHKAEEAAQAVFGEDPWENPCDSSAKGISFYGVGSLHEIAIRKKQRFERFHLGRFSVSKLSVVVSDFISAVWFIIVVYEIVQETDLVSILLAILPCLVLWIKGIIIVLTIGYIVFYFFKLRKGKDQEQRESVPTCDRP